ncbi:MAG: hypothetical protein ABL973_14040 [Micropepsaceae bacterium]
MAISAELSCLQCWSLGQCIAVTLYKMSQLHAKRAGACQHGKFYLNSTVQYLAACSGFEQIPAEQGVIDAMVAKTARPGSGHL